MLCRTIIEFYTTFRLLIHNFPPAEEFYRNVSCQLIPNSTIIYIDIFFIQIIVMKIKETDRLYQSLPTEQILEVIMRFSGSELRDNCDYKLDFYFDNTGV